MEGAYINRKLIIGNPESGTGNWFLVPYLRKRLGYFKTVKSETGNREPGTENYFFILVYYTNVSKVQIGNKEPVPGSLLTIIGIIIVSVFFLFHQHVKHKMILKIKRYFSAYNEYCEVSVEGAYINMKLRIGNRESGTGNWFLVPYLSKRLCYFKIIDRE